MSAAALSRYTAAFPKGNQKLSTPSITIPSSLSDGDEAVRLREGDGNYRGAFALNHPVRKL